MVETVDNIIQFMSTGLVAGISLYRSARTQSRAWTMLGLFSGVYFLGLAYWLLFLLFYQETPEYRNIPDLSWYSAYLFLMLLLIYIREESRGEDAFPAKPSDEIGYIIRKINPMLWLIPVFTGGMCIFFMRYGSYLSNIIAAVFMTGLIWHALAGFISCSREGKKNKNMMFYIVTLLFCMTEYALWISSCIWTGGTLANPYYWIDTALSVVFLLFIPALRKAAGR